MSCFNPSCSKPSYNGKPGEYCGRTCRDRALGPAGGAKCGCGKPTYNGKAGEKCTRSCPGVPGGGGAPARALCACGKPTWNGKPGEKCSKGCRAAAGPQTHMKFGDKLVPGDAKFEEIKRQYESKWGDGSYGKTAMPTIKEIYCVSDPTLEAGHQAYRQQIDPTNNMPCKGSGVNPGNTQRRFHRSHLKCDFKGTLCSDSSCAVCSIMKNGFDMKYCGANAGSRFGAGLYNTSTPSKAYTYGSGKSMFVVSVACGDCHVDTSGQFGNYKLPAGKHCRVADAECDECIVFDNAAMVPRYLMKFD